MAKKKVIYIMGAGRSGTTLLDIVLGNGRDIFSCGEIIKFPALKGCPHGFDIGSENYTTWKSIERRFLDKNTGHSLRTIASLAESIESHTVFLKTMFRMHSDAKVGQYRGYINDIIDSIYEKTGKGIIIDSSKYPGRALALMDHLHYDVYVVYLKRDPVDVVSAFMKRDVEQPYKGFFAANIYLFVIGFFCFLAIKRIAKDRLFIMIYEEFLRDPVSTLARIQRKFDVDLSDPIDLIKGNKPLRVGQLFEGNRIRLQKNIVLMNKAKTASKGMKYYFTRIVNSLWY